MRCMLRVEKAEERPPIFLQLKNVCVCVCERKDKKAQWDEEDKQDRQTDTHTHTEKDHGKGNVYSVNQKFFVRVHRCVCLSVCLRLSICMYVDDGAI